MHGWSIKKVQNKGKILCTRLPDFLSFVFPLFNNLLEDRIAEVKRYIIDNVITEGNANNKYVTMVV